MATETAWHTEKPPDHGYYLGAHLLPAGKLIVSELWYNPDSIGTGWWTSRGYIDARTGYQRPVTIHVIAWAKIPEAPTFLLEEDNGEYAYS